jgi:hypothetical protein
LLVSRGGELRFLRTDVGSENVNNAKKLSKKLMSEMVVLAPEKNSLINPGLLSTLENLFFCRTGEQKNELKCLSMENLAFQDGTFLSVAL